ncbi:glucosaminidase domain-containing protein [Mucilaginibacter sp. UR6-11]|uniref:glucosaminidase domain-containing protein n=1 Tax=Mucilaginibacter sp. UR6-11 TaxID=1435644 RepID=UPI001E5551E9|nr:glucosaminidase domain-containing protein [Mucilaginibacter sp. UR6-11]MCC8424550.1 glucosaminidase domain-containing protein [Mucilaginibacter sp. UR6-11]
MKKTLLITTLLISSITAFAQKNTSKSYIEQFKDNAIQIMHETGIPASIILGIAMHESGNGNSNVAKSLNNQFGFKGGSTTVYYKNNKRITSAYKKYDSILESFDDFARIITHRQQLGRLSDQLSLYDYEKWVKSIQRSGYASSKKWASQVIAIIRKYQLNELDQTPEDEAQLPQTAQNDPSSIYLK